MLKSLGRFPSTEAFLISRIQPITIVKLSLKNPPELSSEGLLNLFHNNIYKLVRYRNYFHDFLAIDFCLDFFVRESDFLQFFA